MGKRGVDRVQRAENVGHEGVVPNSRGRGRFRHLCVPMTWFGTTQSCPTTWPLPAAQTFREGALVLLGTSQRNLQRLGDRSSALKEGLELGAAVVTLRCCAERIL